MPDVVTNGGDQGGNSGRAAEALTRLRRDYAPLLLRYLTQRDESGLRSAYELGRAAMRSSVSLLDVVRVHNETFLGIHATVRDVEEAQRVAEAASAIVVELIASFEMTQRGYMQAHRARGRDLTG